jgi:hypothetical protein
MQISPIRLPEFRHRFWQTKVGERMQNASPTNPLTGLAERHPQ